MLMARFLSALALLTTLTTGCSGMWITMPTSQADQYTNNGHLGLIAGMHKSMVYFSRDEAAALKVTKVAKR